MFNKTLVHRTTRNYCYLELEFVEIVNEIDKKVGGADFLSQLWIHIHLRLLVHRAIERNLDGAQVLGDLVAELVIFSCFFKTLLS